MCSEDGKLWITFNGEIFNYPELRNSLIKKGHIFKTNSDTEVILHLYEDKKEACVNYLNGQFAFSIRNNADDEMFIARDHCGIIPLFYTNTFTGDFIFASEIKALFCDELVERAADICSLDQVFTFWSTLPGHTFFRNIYELPPAHYIKISRGNMQLVKYWEPQFESSVHESKVDIEETCREAISLLLDSVRIRLRSDVPVGAYLSGGIDSSAVTSLIHNYFDNRLHTFGLVFEDEDFNELKYQESAVRHLSTNHISRKVSNNEIAAHYTDMLYHAEKPMLRTAPVPMMLLSEAVKKEGYKVVLSGEGSDEIFGGYNIFRETYIRSFWSRNPSSELRPLLLKKIYPYVFKDKRGYLNIKEFFSYGISDPANPFFSHQVRWRNTSRLKNFYSAGIKNILGDYNPADTLFAMLPENFCEYGYFARAQYLEFKMFLNGYLLSSQGDRAAMANSVELRIPFLDKRLIEFMSHVPYTLKLRGLNEKFLLKKMFRNILPEDILRRQKQPFRAPDKNVFKNNPFLADEFCSEHNIKDAGLFDYNKVSMLMKKLYNGAGFSETDSMAAAGIISSQVIYSLFIKQLQLRTQKIRRLRFFDNSATQENKYEVYI
jgi:asparagine synthase (glutamine-hydrolysing)